MLLIHERVEEACGRLKAAGFRDNSQKRGKRIKLHKLLMLDLPPRPGVWRDHIGVEIVIGQRHDDAAANALADRFIAAADLAILQVNANKVMDVCP